MLKNKDQEQLESYVLGNLSKKEEEIIENRLLTDADLKEEYEFLLLLNKSMLDKSDLEEKMIFLKGLSSNNTSVVIKYKQVFYMAATVLLIIGIGYFNSFNKDLLEEPWGTKKEIRTSDTVNEELFNDIYIDHDQETNGKDSVQLENKE